MTTVFERAMGMMRKHDPQVQEDGFWTLKPVAGEFLPELIGAFESESDPGLRCWLLELIGAARSDDALALLTRELTSDDASLREWAERGLRQLDSKAARTALEEHGRAAGTTR